MPITKDHILGVAVGVGVAAAGFYFYKKNQDKIDDLLRAHGMDIPVNENKPLRDMSVEELAMFKEQIEDMIAERELAAKDAAESEQPSEKPAKKTRRRGKRAKRAAAAPAAAEQPEA